jgi:ectoine hydroxylase-related dioxygenase (phytanoyl-CoA dioxygenase family)
MEADSDRYTATEREEFDLDAHCYLFDTQGYTKVEQVLTSDELGKLNATFDHFESEMQPSPNYSEGATSKALASPDGPTTPSRLDLQSNPLAWPQPWCEPVRQCLCHPKIQPILNMILGRGYRLDHGPGLFLHKKGFAGQTLHGGGASRTDFSEQYMFKSGRIYSGLIVCEFFLADEPVGAGGLSIVPGSHKAHLKPPLGFNKYEVHTHAVTEVGAMAGDVVICTYHTLDPCCLDDARVPCLPKAACDCCSSTYSAARFATI